MDFYKRSNLTNATKYQLGIVFGIGSYAKCESSLFFRHKDKYFLEQIKVLFNSKIYIQKNKGINQYCLKTCIVDIDSLKSLGWVNRNADERKLPELIDYKDFLRAYIELHGYLSYCTSYKGNRKARVKYYRLRLRIYGNNNLVEQINNIFSDNIHIKKKSVQLLNNKKSAYISYTSLDEIKTILTYIYGVPNNKNWWNEAKEKLSNPIKEYL